MTGVQFSVDGAPLGNEIGSAPYEVTWETGTASNGEHVITAVARDAAGHTDDRDCHRDGRQRLRRAYRGDH